MHPFICTRGFRTGGRFLRRRSDPALRVVVPLDYCAKPRKCAKTPTLESMKSREGSEMIRIIFRLVGAITLLATVAFSASLKQTRTGSPATSAPSMPPLTDRVVSEIQDFAKRTSITVPLLGQGKRIFVTSARGQIAYKTPKEGTNARYTPPPEFRSDIVVINCGNAEFGEIFECSRVRVRLPNKREIKPLSYLAQPNTYHNGFGAQWTVRTVLVKYSAPELRDGFSIEYASFDGTEWTFEVSAKQAEEILLLKCGDHGAEQCGQKPEETLVEQKVEEYFGRFTLGTS